MAGFWEAAINTIDHVQFGWILGNVGDFDRRERRLLMLACLTPDIDGIPGLFSDDLMVSIHHTFGHNIFWAIGTGIAVALLVKKNKLKMFILGSLLVLLHFAVDLATSAEYPIRILWPFIRDDWNLPIFFKVTDRDLPHWDFMLAIVVQTTLKIALLGCTVAIYIKYRRTFLELISANLDSFLTDFAILPFKHKCDAPDCKNRAHYRCADNGALRCIKHCTINKNLTIVSK